MPRARTKTKASPEPAAPHQNGPPGEVFTLAEAAAYLRLPEADVLRLVAEQDLPGRQLGGEWRFLKTAVEAWLSRGSLLGENKEAWLALAGVWKDDPYLLDELREIYRRRGRPEGEL